MRPSKASSTSGSASTACGFSILAMRGSRAPTSSMILRTGPASDGPRTKDSAIMSARRPSAHRRSCSSFVLSAGTARRAPGTFRPLWSDSSPPTSTRVRTRAPSTLVTSSTTRPSSTRIWSPVRTSPASPGYVVAASAELPGTSSPVRVNSPPAARTTGPDAKVPSRIFGPCRSTSTPTLRPASSPAARAAW